MSDRVSSPQPKDRGDHSEGRSDKNQSHRSDRQATAPDGQQKPSEKAADKQSQVHSSDRQATAANKQAEGQAAKDPQKGQAAFGDVEKYSKQGKAIRDGNDIRLSEHEHIRARINLYLQTHDKGTSAYTKSDYRASATLTIPKDMAVEKTALDMQLRDELKNALKTGVVSEALIKKMDIQADIQRTIDAKNLTIEKRLAGGKSVEDLMTITDKKIAEAAHLQQGQVFEGGKRQTSPLRDASEKEIDQALKPLEKLESIAGKVGSVVGTIFDVRLVESFADSLEHFDHPERYPEGERFTDVVGREWIKVGDEWVNQAYLDSGT